MGITRINNNVAAITATRHLNASSTQLSKNIERLSSGLRINRAGDDAAGLTIRERLRTQIRGSDMAIRNSQDGISMVSTTEAALDSLVSSLQRIRELAIQAGNTGTNDAPAIQAIQDEVFQQVDEVNRIATTARFSSRILFTGDNANETEVRRGQDKIGVNISADPNASNMRSGTSILNIIRTNSGSENLLPAIKEDGQAIYATGLKDATDIAVTEQRFFNGASPAANVNNLSTLFFGGTVSMTQVPIRVNDTIAFQGFLSDGVTPFAGALSVTTNGVGDLISQIQLAIDNAEVALFGGVTADIPTSFLQTHVSIPIETNTEAQGSGRLRFLSAKSGGANATNADISDGPSNFSINLKVINNTDDLKVQTISTRDYVDGKNIGAQYGNYIQGITGSTFDTGNFGIEVTDIIPPNRRKLETQLEFRDASGSLLTRSASLANSTSGAILNGTFLDSVFTTGDTGIQFETNDTLAIQGLNADGTTFETIFTMVVDPGGATHVDNNVGDGQFETLSGLIKELNNRDRSSGVNYTGSAKEQSAFMDAVFTFSGSGTFQLIDDVAEESKSSLFMIVEDANTTRTLTDRSQVIIEGNPEMATVVVDGGERIRVQVGDEVTLTGSTPTRFGEETPKTIMRIGAGARSSMSSSILNQGTDTLEITAQEYIATLNGGPIVTFQNGDQDVFFESGVSDGVAETLMLDFDAILDITGPTLDGSPNTGMAILLSTVNNALNYQVGAFQGQDLQVNIPDLRGDVIGFGRGSGMTVSDINVTTVEGVNAALSIIDEALDQVSRTRSTLGAFTNRLETTIDSLSSASENLQASESRLSDVDMATEVSAFTSNQILFQAGTSVLGQANFLPQGLLSLLG
jgi:flagellin